MNAELNVISKHMDSTALTNRRKRLEPQPTISKFMEKGDEITKKAKASQAPESSAVS